MEQLTKDEARILLDLVNRPRNYQGTIEEVQKLASVFDGIRKKLSTMTGEPPKGAAPAVPGQPPRKRKRH
jgi:hypothetical protein